MYLLVDAVETRLELKDRDGEEYRRLLEAEQPREVMMMEMTWSEKIERRGEQKGRQALVRRLLSTRFGPLPEKALRRLEAITSPEELDELGERLLTARSLEELGLT